MSQEQLSDIGKQLLHDFPALAALRKHDRKGIDDVIALVENCAAFNREHAEPKALELDERIGRDPDYFDWDLAREAGNHRLFSLVIPEVVGGLAGKYMLTAGFLAFEELCSTCAGIGNMIAATGLGISPMVTPGGLAFWDTVLHEIVEGEKKGKPVLMAYAITEPSAGTDVEEPDFLAKARIGMEAKKVKGGYLLNGRKCSSPAAGRPSTSPSAPPPTGTGPSRPGASSWWRATGRASPYPGSSSRWGSAPATRPSSSSRTSSCPKTTCWDRRATAWPPASSPSWPPRAAR